MLLPHWWITAYLRRKAHARPCGSASPRRWRRAGCTGCFRRRYDRWHITAVPLTERKKAYSRWSQFVTMAMAQLAGRSSLRDIVDNISAQAHRLAGDSEQPWFHPCQPGGHRPPCGGGLANAACFPRELTNPLRRSPCGFAPAGRSRYSRQAWLRFSSIFQASLLHAPNRLGRKQAHSHGAQVGGAFPVRFQVCVIKDIFDLIDDFPP